MFSYTVFGVASLAVLQLCGASYYPNDNNYIAQNDASSSTNKLGSNKDKTVGSDWGISATKSVSFANKNRKDESAKTDEVTFKEGPSYGYPIYGSHGYGSPYGYGNSYGYGGPYGYGPQYGYGYGGYAVPYQGGREYTSSKKDIRKSSDGSTTYDASDTNGEHNKKSAEDISKVTSDAKAAKSNSLLQSSNPGYDAGGY